MNLLRGFLLSVCGSLIVTSSAFAIGTTPTQPPLLQSPLLLTAYGISKTQTSLDFAQIYNSSDNILLLDGWRLVYKLDGGIDPVVITELSGYMVPHSHYIFSIPEKVVGAGIHEYPPLTTGGKKIKTIMLLSPSSHTAHVEWNISADGIFKRNVTSSGAYSTAANPFTKSDTLTQLQADNLYQLPDAPTVRVIEILPRSADCAPNDTSLVCGDYIKLFNASDQEQDLSSYRLRSDSGTSESSNAFRLAVVLAPYAYVTIHLKNDGDKMSLTDSGGYVWLEDAYGITKFYDTTMVSYPSAGSDSKKGWAWAFSDNQWQWTSTPQPDAPNVITVPTVLGVTDSECPAGKYRNPDTGRCKNIEDAIATLVACDEGEYRSPETNRCRAIASTSSIALRPCAVGEERNPSTNRCRKIATTSGGPSPCPAGQERNPETNRCRKVVNISAAPLLTEANENESSSSYWIGGALAASALGYGLYEWRTDVRKFFGRFIPTVK